MTLTASDWAAVVAYLLITLFLGLYFRGRSAKSTEDYFVSGRNVSWWLAGTSMVATTFAADTPLAVTGLVYANGVAGNWLWWSFLPSGMMTVFLFARPERTVLVYSDGNRAQIEARILDSTFLLVHCPLCTIVTGDSLRDSLSRQAESLRGPRMDGAFKAWIGHPVVLQVALGNIKVPLRGKLLKDGGETVRMRIGEGWDVDIYKAMILTVEEDSMVLLPA